MRINTLVDSGVLEQDTAFLSPDESHHLARVLRVHPGQVLTIFDGRGGVADAVVKSVGKQAVEISISNPRKVPPPAVEITLIQAVPKPDRWELVLRKAVELGATSIQPVVTQHTECKANDKKEERWQKIVMNAAQQSEVRWIPEIRPVLNWDSVLASLRDYDLALIGSLYPGAQPFREISFKNRVKVAMLIGPEGDFSEEEVSSAIHEGAVPVSFGSRILRTETAAIFGLSVLSYELL